MSRKERIELRWYCFITQTAIISGFGKPCVRSFLFFLDYLKKWCSPKKTLQVMGSLIGRHLFLYGENMSEDYSIHYALKQLKANLREENVLTV